MAELTVVLEHDVPQGTYTMRYSDEVSATATRLRRGPYGQLFAKVAIDRHGTRLTSSTLNLLDASARLRLARTAGAKNGIGPDYLAPHLDVLADALDTEIPLTEEANDQRSLRVTPLSTVSPVRVDFLWKPFVPLGRPVALEGDPGIGKSALVAKIVAHLTTGHPFPTVLEGLPPMLPFPPCTVCLLTSEDDPGDTILPRVVVNGGDPSRVFVVEGWERPDGERGIVTMQDLRLLQDALETYQPALLVFDPVQSFFGVGIDMNHANDTRPVLDAVVALCKVHGCTPLFVRHVGKAARQKAIHAALGSIDITAAMRSVLFLGQDPEHPDKRVLAHAKSNNAAAGQSLSYVIETREEVILTPEGDSVTIEAPRLRWDGLSTLTANDLAAAVERDDEEEKSALDQAKEFLLALLEHGPVLSDDVHKAVKQAGIKLMTLRRAKPLVGVKVRRRPEDGKNARAWLWEWYLPSEPSSTGSSDTPPDAHIDDHLEHLEEVIENIGGYPDVSRCSDDHLEASRKPQENQQDALEFLDDHVEDTPGKDAKKGPFVCPDCGQPLTPEDDRWRCSGCGETFLYDALGDAP